MKWNLPSCCHCTGFSGKVHLVERKSRSVTNSADSKLSYLANSQNSLNWSSVILHRLKRKLNVVLISMQIFSAHEVVDGSVTLIKNAVCGTIIDPDRLLLGAEEGLFCVDLDNCGESWAVILELMLGSTSHQPCFAIACGSFEQVSMQNPFSFHIPEGFIDFPMSWALWVPLLASSTQYCLLTPRHDT